MRSRYSDAHTPPMWNGDLTYLIEETDRDSGVRLVFLPDEGSRQPMALAVHELPLVLLTNLARGQSNQSSNQSVSQSITLQHVH